MTLTSPQFQVLKDEIQEVIKIVIYSGVAPRTESDLELASRYIASLSKGDWGIKDIKGNNLVYLLNWKIAPYGFAFWDTLHNVLTKACGDDEYFGHCQRTAQSHTPRPNNKNIMRGSV